MDGLMVQLAFEFGTLNSTMEPGTRRSRQCPAVSMQRLLGSDVGRSVIHAVQKFPPALRSLATARLFVWYRTSGAPQTRSGSTGAEGVLGSLGRFFDRESAWEPNNRQANTTRATGIQR